MARASDRPAGRAWRLWAALAAVALIAAGAWGAMRLRSGPPAGEEPAQVAARRQSDAPVVTPAAPPPAPAAHPATSPAGSPSLRLGPAAPPEPAAPPAVAVAQPPPLPAPAPALPGPALPALDSRVDAATSRDALLDLLAAGADVERVTARFKTLGYVPVASGAVQILRRPGGGEPFSDCEQCPELVIAPAGVVSMRISTAAGTRDLTIPVPTPFAVGRYEVTRAQFRAFVDATGHAVQRGCHRRMPDWRDDPALSWQDPGYAQDDDHPVACVSWQDAKAYAAWLSQKTGQRYRLPTDPEWHHLAARGRLDPGDARGLCANGNGADETARDGNPGWSVAACRDGYANTAPVGRFKASDWGLSDLDGNLWEWVETCAPDAAVPDQPFPPPSCTEGAGRILRGGSFADPPAMRTLDSRLVSAPGIRDQVAGFRIAREVMQ